MILNRTASYKPLLFIYCLFALFAITILLFAGGFTTSIKAGMAFLDWPLSNGSINPEGWLTEKDKFAEHSHRLLGIQIGVIAIGLVIFSYLKESRSWVRRLSLLLLLIIIAQGLLGGARVLFDQLNTLADSNILAQFFLVFHASGAMIVLIFLVSITLSYSKNWIQNRFKYPDLSELKKLKLFSIVSSVALFIQILLGAVMRHADAGLAIAKFPLANQNSFLPSYWDFAISIHFSHRVGALIVTLILFYFCYALFKNKSLHAIYSFFPTIIISILSFQIYLGALTIWSAKNPYAATVHHLVGAFLLASVWAITFILNRKSLT